MSSEETVIFRPSDYADLVIKNVEHAHMAKKDDFLGVAVYRDLIIRQFEDALRAAYSAGIRRGRVDAEAERVEGLKGDK